MNCGRAKAGLGENHKVPSLALFGVVHFPCQLQHLAYAPPFFSPSPSFILSLVVSCLLIIILSRHPLVSISNYPNIPTSPPFVPPHLAPCPLVLLTCTQDPLYVQNTHLVSSVISALIIIRLVPTLSCPPVSSSCSLILSCSSSCPSSCPLSHPSFVPHLIPRFAPRLIPQLAPCPVPWLTPRLVPQLAPRLVQVLPSCSLTLPLALCLISSCSRVLLSSHHPSHIVLFLALTLCLLWSVVSSGALPHLIPSSLIPRSLVSPPLVSSFFSSHALSCLVLFSSRPLSPAEPCPLSCLIHPSSRPSPRLSHPSPPFSHFVSSLTISLSCPPPRLISSHTLVTLVLPSSCLS